MIPVLLTLFLISGAMACQDFVGTVLVAAIDRGRASLAGLMDALGDLARTVSLVVGIDSINAGLKAENLALLLRPTALLVLGTQMATSYNVTRWATKRSQRMKAADSVPRDGVTSQVDGSHSCSEGRPRPG